MADHREKPFPLKPIDERELVDREYAVRFVLPDGRRLEAQLTYSSVKHLSFGQRVQWAGLELIVGGEARQDGTTLVVPVEIQMFSSYGSSAP